MTMLVEALQWIAKAAGPEKITSEDGREWIKYTDGGYTPIRPAAADPLCLTGLAALVRFISDLDETRDPLVVIVESMREVTLCGELDDKFRDREPYAQTLAGITNEFKSGQWMDQNLAVRSIQQFFEDSGDRSALLTLVGNLVSGQSRTLVDDGTTQQATTKTGIEKLVMADVPNPVTLQPIETFAEIENPMVSYIVRLQQDEEKEPLISLHRIPEPQPEAATMDKIRLFLSDEVGNNATIL